MAHGIGQQEKSKVIALSDRTEPCLTPPAFGHEPIPIDSYIDPARYDIEREAVFRQSWLYVARESEVAEPGDFIVRDVEILPASALIARGKDGKIRAFHNVCPHRANKLVWEDEKNRKDARSSFMGWLLIYL